MPSFASHLSRLPAGAVRGARAMSRRLSAALPRRIGAFTYAALALAGPAMVPNHAVAQGAAPPQPTERFVAVDVFGGTHPESSTSTLPNPPSATFGWEIGSTVRVDRRFGIYGGVGRVRTPERHWITHVQVGPRVMTTLGRITDLRTFAHVLVGRATSERASGATASSGEVLLGGGLDALNVFRVQVDFVRRALPGFPKNNGRFLFGVAIPLCFRGCRAGDGLDLSRR